MAIRNNKLGGSDFQNEEVLEDFDLDDTNNALIDLAAVGVAQNAYQTLKHAGTFDNKDNLGADRFTDVDGVNNTVDTGSSTMLYDGANDKYVLGIIDEASGDTTHDPNSVTNPENAFDGDNSTFANLGSNDNMSYVLGKTFTSRTVDYVSLKVEVDHSQSPNYARGYIQTYDGSSWSTHTTIFNQTNSIIYEGFSDISSAGDIQGIRILLQGDTDSLKSMQAKWYKIEYGSNFQNSTLLCNQNLPTLTGNEKSICVYADEVNTANTNITYNISDGTTTTSDLALNTVNGIASLGSGQLTITFNGTTTESTETSELLGYSYYIN